MTQNLQTGKVYSSDEFIGHSNSKSHSLKIKILGFFKSELIIKRKKSASYNEENLTDFDEVIIKYFQDDI